MVEHVVAIHEVAGSNPADCSRSRSRQYTQSMKETSETLKLKDSWTQTSSGLQFFPFNPDRNKFLITDIAHSLSMVNRYNGHTPLPYSVAQHCVYVSLECDPKDAFWGLMHDASEAYIGDLISPVKRFMPAYTEVEDVIMAAVCRTFGMDLKMPDSVKKADLTVLAAEARDLFPVKPADWKLPYPPVARKIKPVGWRAAQRMFLGRYNELAHDLGIEKVDFK